MKKMKKSTKAPHPAPHRKVIIPTVAVVILAVAGLLLCYFSYSAIHNEARKNRITAIYDSLDLDSTYLLQDSNIFGDKRPYEWDSSRSYSSSRRYIHAASVSTTVTDLKSKIAAAGFHYFEAPYPGATFTELHFKSAKNEYVRLNVSSKLRDDYFQDRLLMHQPVANTIDPNAGPSNVTIKVNLDDNNE